MEKENRSLIASLTPEQEKEVKQSSVMTLSGAEIEAGLSYCENARMPHQREAVAVIGLSGIGAGGRQFAVLSSAQLGLLAQELQRLRARIEWQNEIVANAPSS